MKKSKKKAFTLTELLVVVIVLGVLAGVAAPKFKRVLETRKTSEAESMLAAVRTEQEKRCVAGKRYQTDDSKVEALANAKTSKNYNYTLTSSGAEAVAKNAAGNYKIKMMSYQDGSLCCDGTGCSALNKNYPTCPATVAQLDECAADLTCDDGARPTESTVTREEGGCQNTYTQKVQCDTSYGVWVEAEWVLTDSQCGEKEVDCSANPKQPKCCTEDQEWDYKSNKCVEKKCPVTVCHRGKILNPSTCNCRACTEKEQELFPDQCCALTRFSDRSKQWWNPATKSCEIKTCPEGEVAYQITLPIKGLVAGNTIVGCCKNGVTSNGYTYWDGSTCVKKTCQEGEEVKSSCDSKGQNCTYECVKNGDDDDDNPPVDGDDDDDWGDDDDDDWPVDWCEVDACFYCWDDITCGDDDDWPDDDDDWPSWGGWDDDDDWPPNYFDDDDDDDDDPADYDDDWC